VGPAGGGAVMLEFRDAEKTYDPQAVYGGGKKPSGA
jgi:hypothetical protein